MNHTKSEFLARRGLVGELSHGGARKEVDPPQADTFLAMKKVTKSPSGTEITILKPLCAGGETSIQRQLFQARHRD